MTATSTTSRVRSGHMSTGRTIVARVCPNEDLAAAVEEICRQYGIANAVLRGGIGSLIGATFTNPDGTARRVEGPGTEVATLVGHVATPLGATGMPQAEMTCTLVDKHGHVHAGRLTRGENPVAVTYELSIQEILSVNPA